MNGCDRSPGALWSAQGIRGLLSLAAPAPLRPACPLETSGFSQQPSLVSPSHTTLLHAVARLHSITRHSALVDLHTAISAIFLPRLDRWIFSRSLPPLGLLQGVASPLLEGFTYLVCSDPVEDGGGMKSLLTSISIKSPPPHTHCTRDTTFFGAGCCSQATIKMTLFAASLLICLLCSLHSSSWAEVPEAKPEAKSRCPVGTYSYNDGRAWYCYEYYEYSLPFEDAEAICQQNRNGGHLASITSETQTRLIGGYLSQVTRGQAAEVWIGLHRQKNSDMYSGWQWIDGTYFRYTSWLGGTPNNIGGRQLCVLLTRGSGFKSWDDGTCTYGRPFLCKWRAS